MLFSNNLLVQLEIKRNNEEKRAFQIKLAEIEVRVGQMTDSMED